MKIVKLWLIVSLIVLSCCTAAAAEDAHFTCESNIADFNGKTFENLYLDLEGCGTVDFDNLTVAGNLIYNGGKDTEDHYVTFNRPSIKNMFVPCEPTHECHFIFDADEETGTDFSVSEMTLLPSGNEKGKIFVQGSDKKLKLTKTLDGRTYNKEVFLTDIERVNFIIGEWNDEIKASLGQKDNVPASMPSYTDLSGDIEIALSSIHVQNMSVVNTDDDAVSSINLSFYAEIDLLATHTHSLKIYEPEQTYKYLPSINSFITSIDGRTMDLSIDHVIISLAHVLGNNKNDSILNLKAGFEKMHDYTVEIITNLFLFGSNMNFAGYKTPDRDEMNLVRLVITEQPNEYSVEDSPSILNEFLSKYEVKEYAGRNIYLDPVEYEKLLDINFAFQYTSIRILSDLSQKYAVDYPDSDTNWKPHFNLSYVNVGKAVCAQSIAQSVPALNMFQITHESFMYMKRDVMRYVMPEGLTESLADEPRIYTGFDPLPGCHTYRFNPLTMQFEAID